MPYRLLRILNTTLGPCLAQTPLELLLCKENKHLLFKLHQLDSQLLAAKSILTDVVRNHGNWVMSNLCMQIFHFGSPVSIYLIPYAHPTQLLGNSNVFLYLLAP